MPTRSRNTTRSASSPIPPAPEPPVESTAPDGTATAAAPTDDQFYGADVDGEVSVKMSDFPAGPIEKDPRIVMPAEDVEVIVRASANFGGSETDMAALSFIDPGGSGDEFAGEPGSEDPFTAMGVKIVPENVSNVAKSEDDNPGMEDGGESFIAIAKGQSFRELLEENEISESDVEGIVAALAELVDLNAIHVGQKVRDRLRRRRHGGRFGHSVAHQHL